jgi:hypothetical protein
LLNFFIYAILTAIFITFCFIVIIKRKHLLIKGKHLLALKQEQKKEFLSVLLLSLVVSMMILPITMFSTYLLDGRVTISMEKEIYPKNDSMIPASIQITGENVGLNISLYLNDNSSPEYSINITPRINSNREIPKGTDSPLIGNAIDISSYYIYINTPNLPVGCYELVVTPSGIDKSYSKGFCLLKK